ncbi:beta-ketoacyl-acyl carrier protein synthase II (involved in pimelate synthesis) [Petrocella atlantisensis]|uniref:3-oxoacyl-[acyl-carrier-protein] synthase 2 n=1 Tax=Petrocella atlantisensis TaxID=2173034 RepID=A0A3P7P2P8_9FIRM|nr:beta-ketoacyl-ACP synthase II [Petrocella atlantisensis]PKM54432.1 MAG: beta-ketoacyl-[acyl-carrier-protein] synthase II [Firmicutes bacterium HGW-Firmicutes-5]VDN47780.1 beta-ketoacyl-acyl carrier protein synthase II (involved in pimelate synthesis) [Petrocella atlantisensis]
MSRRVVVTGIGAITPIGNNVDQFWSALKEGVSGVDMITQFDASDYPVKIAAELKDYNPKDFLDRKDAKRMERFSQFAVIAAGEALAMSGLEVTEENCDRIGTFIGSGMGSLGMIEEEEQRLLEFGPQRVAPLIIPKIIVNMAAGNVAIKYGLKGPSHCIVSACASGSHSIGEAFRNIKFGYMDVAVTGGTESCITPMGIAGFSALTALSTNPDPKKASRPFDGGRDGFVMGEGAGILVLEALDHALERGATILAEIAGYGATTDAYHMTSPAPGGVGGAKAMTLAINEAGLLPSEVDYINAHGTSTPYNDKFETEAIKVSLGEHASKVAINSTKSMTGHLLGAAGGVEAVVCIKSIQEDYLHPTINQEIHDPECDLDYVPNVGRSAKVNVALSNSLGFGGHNATLLFKKYK